MCSHVWLKINDVQVCRKCGLTAIYDGKIMFDKKINQKRKKRKKAVNV